MKIVLSKKQFTQQLAKRVRKLRRSKGISQEELAHRADLYRTYVGHVENARYSPTAYVIYKIASVLKTESSEILPF